MLHLAALSHFLFLPILAQHGTDGRLAAMRDGTLTNWDNIAAEQVSCCTWMVSKMGHGHELALSASSVCTSKWDLSFKE